MRAVGRLADALYGILDAGFGHFLGDLRRSAHNSAIRLE